eukprot:5742243-Prymnesium_polylepis.1
MPRSGSRRGARRRRHAQRPRALLLLAPLPVAHDGNPQLGEAEEGVLAAQPVALDEAQRGTRRVQPQ